MFPASGSEAPAGETIGHHEIATPDGTLHAISGERLTGTPVMLIHGMSSSSMRWVDAGVTGALTRAGRNWIALDLRGHGASMKPYGAERYTLPLLLGDIERAISTLDLGRVDLVGYSLGGHLASEYAVGHPHRVRSLVVGGFDGGSSPPPEGIERRLRSYMEEDTPLPTVEAARVWASISAPGNDASAVLSCFEAAMQSIRVRRARPALAGYPGPVLVCAGRNDHVARNIEGLATLTRQGIARWLGDHDHSRTMMSPEFADALLDFLGKFPADG